MTQKILFRGAEAILTQQNSHLTKNRIKKSYRLPFLDDKLRKSRTKREAKLLSKLSKIIQVPALISTNNKDEIKMQFIEGKKLSEHLDTLKNANKICRQIGNSVAILHDNNIIHGDLTTSNMILAEKDNKIYFIDFGLSFHSNRIEDKAVDLHLLRQALEAKHFKNWKTFFIYFFKGYNPKDKALILQQLKKVESRGRYKKGF